MTYFDWCYRKVPKYYHTMYFDGYTPEEILYSHKRMMLDDFEAESRVDEIKITSEVKIR